MQMAISLTIGLGYNKNVRGRVGIDDGSANKVLIRQNHFSCSFP